MWTLVGLLLAGSFAGTLGALLGLGGGIFLVPVLTLVFHLPIRVAVGTSLVAVIATSAGVAAAASKGRGPDVALALRLELVTAAGAILGGWAAGWVSHSALSILFAFVVFLTASYTFYKSRRRQGAGSREHLFLPGYEAKHWPAGLLVSSLAGAVSGLLGVGGGFIKVPLMYAVMEVPLGIATATSNFMVGITAAASVFVYYGRGDVHPLVVIPTAIGVFAGAMLGVHILSRTRAAWVRTLLIGLLLVLGVQMLVHGLRGES